MTVPHHFVTWLRVYGSPGEFARFKERFIWGPVLLIGFCYLLLHYAPLSLVLIVTLWDHQHSLMQQYGFARVYDFKAKTGSPSTAKFDLAFSWVFFVNMLVVSPLFSTLWVRMLHEWHVPIGAEGVQAYIKFRGRLPSSTALFGCGISPGRCVRATRSIHSNTLFWASATFFGISPASPRNICSSLRWRIALCTACSTS